MPEGFDPYHTWLGIGPEEQPPNYYRLLGIRLLESDPVVIENAADRQMAHLRTFQTGKRSELSQKLLNEVAAAKICLLNPEKKAAYDLALQTAQVAVVTPRENRRAVRRRRSGPQAVLVAIAIGLLAVIGLVTVGLYVVPPRPQNGASEPKGPPPSPPPPPAPGPPSSTPTTPSSLSTGKAPADLDAPPAEPPATKYTYPSEETGPETVTPDHPAPSGPVEPPEAEPLGPTASPSPPEDPFAKPPGTGVEPPAPAVPPTPAKGPPAPGPGPKLGPQAAAPLKGPPLVCRERRHREALLAKYGGTEKSEEAVAAALKWIAAQQWLDGGWSFAHQTNPARNGRGRDPGSMAQARNAATGLALMALLGSGQTHRDRSDEYRKNIQMGLTFLCSRTQLTPAGGSFREEGGTMYSHAMATIALCDAYTMTRDRNLRAPAQQAIKFIWSAQDPQGGGWRYDFQTRGDTSVSGWQLAALSAGYYGGLEVPGPVVQRARGYLDQVQLLDGSRYGYLQPQASNATMTAVGLMCRMRLGWSRGNPALDSGVQWLATQGPDRANIYHNYHVTQVIFHCGGQAWEKWNPPMRDLLLGTQAADAEEPGSWYWPGFYNESGGRLCCTALATLILETYYRYPPGNEK